MRTPIFILATGLCTAVIGQIQPTWSNSYQQATNKNHFLVDMEVNGDGDVWMYGRASDPLGTTGVVVKFIDQGLTQAWAYEFPTIAAWYTDMDIDGQGNAYITASDYDTSGITRESFRTIKLDTDGNLQWSAMYTGNGPNSWDRPSSLVVDGEGNTIVTGFSEQQDYNVAWLTVKYAPNGDLLWAATHIPPTFYYGSCGGMAIACDAQDNIYVSGESNDTTNGNFAVIKYGPDGSEQWQRREGGGGASSGSQIQVTGDRVYLAGQYTYGALDSTDIRVAAYDTDGMHLWSSTFNAPAYWDTSWWNYYEVVRDLRVDAAGNAYVGGIQFAGNGWHQDYMLMKYDPDGQLLWHHYFDMDHSMEYGRSVLVKDDGSVFISGSASGAPEGIRPAYTVKYDALGELQWYAPYTTGTNEYYDDGIVREDANGHIYVGTAERTSGGKLVLLRYGATTGIEHSAEGPASLLIHPVPMTSTSQLDLRNLSGIVRIELVDASGRIVRRFSASGGRSIELYREDLENGAYIVHATDGHRNVFGRLVIQ